MRRRTLPEPQFAGGARAVGLANRRVPGEATIKHRSAVCQSEIGALSVVSERLARWLQGKPVLTAAPISVNATYSHLQERAGGSSWSGGGQAILCATDR